MRMSEGIGSIAAALAKAQGDGDREAEGRLMVQFAKTDPLPPLVGRLKAGETQLSRFMRRVMFGASDCWYWRDINAWTGYGESYMFGEQRAHRVAWRLFNGDIPDGLLVCHKCDVRNCVNPDHLFLGTYADNNHDRNAKGRAPRGYKRPSRRNGGAA